MTSPKGMSHLLRSTVIVTGFTFGSLAINAVVQVIIASAFGSRPDMDAFLAANTLPQYTNAILLGSLSFVIIPVFVDYAATGRLEEARHVAGSVAWLSLIILGGIALLGMIWARPLLEITTPGLSAETLDIAVTVALVTWPSIVATGLISLLAGLYQAQNRFGWQAAVPFVGALINLVTVWFLVPTLGVVGVSIAATASLILQVILLLPIFLRGCRLLGSFDPHHSGVRKVFKLLLPLVLSGLFVRWTPIIDRYLASNLAEGTISHLEYAFKLVGLLSSLIATGIATVIFPRMALNVAGSDMLGLRRTISHGLRVMWILIAPVITLGIALSIPIVSVMFMRGVFTPLDTAKVASILQIYLLALIGMCLGNITGRAFYALKETKLVAIMGVIEAALYVFYTPFLASYFGVSGIAFSYVLYFSLSLIWQSGFIRVKSGNVGGRIILISFAQTTAAAIIGGVTAWSIVRFVSDLWMQLLLGAIGGSTAYLIILRLLDSKEILLFQNIIARFMSRYLSEA
ncbi:MAG: hypothetical protein B6D41_10910 [Chloroflexi bacterium UTCFX4]|jgi:putative peptidoglycan lipid II flippase|nr:MAG: hypothetical protein B6D41_10910 [Chloroflexi bacterium UTCFX4]